MPAKRQSIPVPLFSAYEISLAQECALELWRGFDFESDDEKEMSDEELLHSFSSSFHAVLSNPNTPHSITEYEVRRLARVAKIKAFYRSAIPTDFPAGIQSLETNVTKNYRQWRSRSAGSSRKSLVLDSVIQVSSDFVTNPGHSPMVTIGCHWLRVCFFMQCLRCQSLHTQMHWLKNYNFSHGLKLHMHTSSMRCLRVFG